MSEISNRIITRAIAAAIVVFAIVYLGLFQTSRPHPTADLRIVIRTPPHLESERDIAPLVKRLSKRGVKSAWIQVKQDETDEFVAGSVFYPSDIAPVAEGFQRDILGQFIDELATKNIEPLAWMPLLHDRRAADNNPQWRSVWIAENGELEHQPDWLCPYHPEVAQYQASLAQEVVARYPKLQGLYIDFIRYDDDFACACQRCLEELESLTGWRDQTGRPLEPIDIRRAAQREDALWQAWIELRAEKIIDVINTVRDAVEEVRPNFHIGAFVLPFSSQHYEFNTQSGQDLERMAQAGLDELVLMGYWDDWDLSPRWVRDSIDAATRLVADNAQLSFVLDGDMGVRRTRLTLEALGEWAPKAGWFHYWQWSEREFDRLLRAVKGHWHEGAMPKPKQVSVVIRIDTEPDYTLSYDNVDPSMIETLLRLFDEEGVKATFITVAKIAEQQTEVLQRAVEQGHEIGSHAFDHEQIDALEPDQQIEVVDRALSTMHHLGFKVYGFGAPRNSITPEARDRLIAWNLEYDGSAAYDPLSGFLDVHYVAHEGGLDTRILVIPFIMPNDWDARYVAGVPAIRMLEQWIHRLDHVVESGEPVFVLDVHQWSASQPNNLAALRLFIRYVKHRPDTRIVTLREAAREARKLLDRFELPAPTSGDRQVPLPKPEINFDSS